MWCYCVVCVCVLVIGIRLAVAVCATVWAGAEWSAANDCTALSSRGEKTVIATLPCATGHRWSLLRRRGPGRRVTGNVAIAVLFHVTTFVFSPISIRDRAWYERETCRKSCLVDVRSNTLAILTKFKTSFRRWNYRFRVPFEHFWSLNLNALEHTKNAG